MYLVTNNTTYVTNPILSFLLSPSTRFDRQTVRTNMEANDVRCKRVHALDEWRRLEIWVVREVHGEFRFPFGNVIANAVFDYPEMMLVYFILIRLVFL